MTEKTNGTKKRRIEPKYVVLLACWSVWFVNFLVRMSVPVMLPSIQLEFDITYLELGLMMSALTFGYAVSQIPSGLIADRTKKKYVIVPGMVLFSIAMFAGALSNTSMVLILMLLTAGLGLGTYYPAATSLIAAWFDRGERGRAFGIHETASSVGSVAGPLLGGYLVFAFGWREGFTVLLLPGLLAIPIIWYLGKEPEIDLSGLKKEKIVLNPILLPTAVYTLLIMGWMAFTTFLPSYLTDVGYSDFQAGIMFGLMPLVSVASMPLAGHYSDKFGRKKVIITLLTISSPLALLVTFIQHWVPLVLMFILIGMTMFAAYPVVIALISDKIPASNRAGTFGFVNAIGMLFASTTPTGVGHLIDIASYRIAFLTISIMVLAAAITMLRVKKPDES
ncbi:MFS transporter [Methanonatronarchaeum sp. AMET6-2]|uniref:MFS transporter n=1 Tax=Methanonatronarchaeum sp. AMET6-2 TaxID=2933293 RepID=UPI001213B469|nr:MFS transporter [Methanonatronarchaeum sp. AMET6-2]RZN62916.1 MAG: MFS transporter [Methanonatronarchaeia archaeon]UOY09848.1 MFS transporter [Methanonatronarchaeum sp. AMET6-2]